MMISLAILAVVVVVLLGVYLSLAFNCAFTQMTYMTGYETWFSETRDSFTAHKKAIENFHYRPPFNKLTEKDINVMAKEFGKLPDPRLAAKLMRHMDKTKNLGDFLGAGDRPDPDLMKN